MYTINVTLMGLMYGFFAGQSCTLNQSFTTFNLILCIIMTILCVLPAVQEANPLSGLAQASMVALYCTYPIMSAVGNHIHATCNPLTKYAGTRKGTVVLAGPFTFVAIAYSTTRAATQGRALVGENRNGGIASAGDDDLGRSRWSPRSRPRRIRRGTRRSSLLSRAGAIPASALYEMDEDEEGDSAIWEERDSERTGTRYNVPCSSAVWLAYLN